MWEPPMETVKEPIRKLMESDNFFFFFLEKLHLGRERNSNFTYQEIKALNKQNQDIIIKPADKGSKIVITDKTQYLIETSKHLQNPLHYKSLSESLQGETKNMIFIKLYKINIFPINKKPTCSFWCLHGFVKSTYCRGVSGETDSQRLWL